MNVSSAKDVSRRLYRGLYRSVHGAWRGLWLAPRWTLLTLVRAYRFFLSPWLGSACRFTPSCSTYAVQALQMHGALGGTYLVTRRLLRCHPWCAGGCDPVPKVSLSLRRLVGRFTVRP